MISSSRFKLHSILKIVGNVVFYGILLLLILFSFATMKMKQEDNVANIFGRGFMSVQTGSMIGNNPDSFTPEDIIFVKMFQSKNPDDVQIGDIIVFYKLDLDDNALNGSQPGFVTHRVNDKFQINDTIFFETKGDANASSDQFAISAEEIIAIYQSKFVGGGSILKYIQTPQGFAATIIIPVALMLLLQGFFLVRNIITLNKEKVQEHLETEKEAQIKALEAEKEKMRQQILEELKAQQKS